jgi:hypothetical protein
MDLQKDYDRVLVIAASAIAILGGGFLAFQAMGFKAQFERDAATEGQKLDAQPGEAVTVASKLIDKAVVWTRPKIGGHKSIPLFASTPFFLKMDKADSPIDMLADDAPQVREPIANWWLAENGLDYKNIRVGDEDPDGDDYSNLDEFQAQTDPNSQLSKPAFITKLRYEGRGAEPLTLKLSSFDPTSNKCAISITKQDDAGTEVRKTEYKDIGELVGERFKILERKQEDGELYGSKVKLDVIMLEDLKDKEGNPLRLVQGSKSGLERPTFYANLRYTLSNDTFKVKKGDDLELKRPPVTVTVIEIGPDHATVEYVSEGKTTPETKRLSKTDAPK